MSTCKNSDAKQSHIEQIQALYTELAKTPHKDFGWDKGKDNARALGYAEDWLSRLPLHQLPDSGTYSWRTVSWTKKAATESDCSSIDDLWHEDAVDEEANA